METGLIVIVIGFLVAISGMSERVKIKIQSGTSVNGPIGAILMVLGALNYMGII